MGRVGLSPIKIFTKNYSDCQDEIDDVSDEYIIKEDDNRYRVSGKTTLYDFERFFKADIEAFEASDSVTVAGMSWKTSLTSRFRCFN